MSQSVSKHILESPCTRYCIIDRKSGFCEGCFRKMEEIISWSKYNDEEKLQIMSQIENRKHIFTSLK